MRRIVAALLCLLALAPITRATSLESAAQRIDADVAAGKPLIAHVVVALVDNQHQGIVPVPAALGDGTMPRTNLYWGAMYGVRTFFRNSAGWRALPIPASADPRILDRVMFHRVVERGGKHADVYLVAEAWKGEHIDAAIAHFLEMNRGDHAELLRAGERQLAAGGAAHVVAFIGHNGLMDFPVPTLSDSRAIAPAHASIVLACYSDHYFATLMREHSAPLLTTAGLMAPEAYTLDAALESWFSGGDARQVRTAAARAYAHFQKSSEHAAQRLFLTAK